MNARDVVGDHVSEDRFVGALGRDVFGHAPDDDGKFDFVDHIGKVGRKHDRIVRADDGCIGFEKHEKLVHRSGRFPVAIGSPETNDFRTGDHGRNEPHFLRVEPLPGRFAFAEQGIVLPEVRGHELRIRGEGLASLEGVGGKHWRIPQLVTDEARRRKSAFRH